MESPSERKAEDVWNLISSTLAELGVPPEQITRNATIADDLGLESVAFVELQVTLEDELGIEIDPIRVVELNELSAIVQYLCDLPCSKP
jgi:acyl carrier protein